MREIRSLDDLEIGSEIRYIDLYGFVIRAVKISHSLLILGSGKVVESWLYRRENNKLYFGDDYNTDHMVDRIYDTKGNIIYNHEEVKEPELNDDSLGNMPF